jgi:hypothetical protein
VALAHFRAEIPASAGMTRRRRPPRLPPARSTTSSRIKMGADVAASPRFPKLTIAMPRQGHHPLGGWAPRDGASAVSGPRGSRPGRVGLGGSLRAEDKAEAWMPSSRFRSPAACSRTPLRFEEAASERAPKPSPSPTLGSAGNQGSRLPPRSVRTCRRSARSAPPGTPPTSKPAAKTAFATHETEASSDPSNRPTIAQGPKPSPNARFATSKSERTPIPRTAGPSREPRPSLGPVSRFSRSKRTPILRTAGCRRRSKPLCRHPFREPRDRGEPRSLRRRTFQRKPKPSPQDPFESGSAEAFAALASVRSLGARALRVPGRVSPGRRPKAPAGGPAGSSEPGAIPEFSLTGMWLRLAILAGRVGSAGSSRRCDRRLALSTPPPAGTLASGFRNMALLLRDSRILSALAGGLPVRPLRAFPSVHEEEAVTL